MTDLKLLFQKHLKEIEDAAKVLSLSYEKCKLITVEPDLDNEKLEHFEALTARFSRLSDLFLQKALRTLDAIDLETGGTIRDRIHRAEKRGVVQSADTLVQIRMLRNEIAHEYKTETIYEIFEKVVSLTPELLNAVDNLQRIGRSYI